MNYNSLIAEYLGTVLLVLSVFASGGNALFIGLTLAAIIFVSGKGNPGTRSQTDRADGGIGKAGHLQQARPRAGDQS